MADAGIVVVVSLVSPYADAPRRAPRAARGDGLPFVEVWVSTPLEECERRDPKGLYARARRGELQAHDRRRRPVRAAGGARARAAPGRADDSVAALGRPARARRGVASARCWSSPTFDSEQITDHRRRDEFFWLDLAQPSDQDLDALREALDLHPMALEDTREFGQRPKVDAYQDYVLIVFFTALESDDPERVVHPVEVHVYVSGHWIVTVHREPLPLLQRLHDELEPAGTHEEDYLVYRILDGLTDAFFPAVVALEDRIDAVEAEVLERPRRELLGSVYRCKQEAHEAQWLIAGQRDQFQTASERILELAGLEGTREYLRDIGDHLAQIGGELQRQERRPDLAHRGSTSAPAPSGWNRTATRLSVVATFFVVWTLITGFFGQELPVARRQRGVARATSCCSASAGSWCRL